MSIKNNTIKVPPPPSHTSIKRFYSNKVFFNYFAININSSHYFSNIRRSYTS